MKILINRFLSTGNETLGALYIKEGKRYIFQCFTLEDEFRVRKVFNETRIPKGSYAIEYRRMGRLHNKYSLRFPNMHKGMLHLKDVPNFKYIYIHIGNVETDTSGCILVGTNIYQNGGKFKITQSTEAYVHIYQKVSDALDVGEEVICDIVDSDMFDTIFIAVDEQ